MGFLVAQRLKRLIGNVGGLGSDNPQSGRFLEKAVATKFQYFAFENP